MRHVSSKTRRTAAPSDFSLERFLPYRLSLLANTVSQGIARSYRDKHDISVTEWRIMAVLGRYPGLTASEVVERTAMDKVAISRGVRTLMDKGLLRRKTDRGDRRRRRLFIGPGKGRHVLNTVIPGARGFEDALLQALDGKEAHRFMRTLEKLQHRAEEISGG